MDFFILVDILVGPESIGEKAGTMELETEIVYEVETGIEPESAEIVSERTGAELGVELFDSVGLVGKEDKSEPVWKTGRGSVNILSVGEGGGEVVWNGKMVS